ncbi:MAG TPA: sugar MFS transporter [Steroidobacteraceae bacterium]|jgi:FHS family L-fucose permease-like MFS transporter|nr:sugar MFS transporter [Steroidobacteraceae bacterium]
MAADTSELSLNTAAKADIPENYPGDLRTFVYLLFFAFGGITSLNDVVIPKLKGLFTLSYGDVMLVQSAFFAAYFVISLPAAELIRRIGYMRSAVAGLLTMTLGCLLFIPGSYKGQFGLFLLALFVLASGITIVQVVANPLIAGLGPATSASSRLTFAQAFNSLGTTIFPYVGSILILGSIATVDPTTLSESALTAFRSVETRIIVRTYLGLALALLLLSALVWTRRRRLAQMPIQRVSVLRAFDLLTRPRFAFGTLCIFLYVGAEVAIGSVIVNYLMQTDVLGLGAEAAGKHVPLYWGGAMIGRFFGAYLLRIFQPGKVLAFAAAAVVALLLVSSSSTGAISGWALLSIGLFNSIMFPTIFCLALSGLAKRVPEGSGLLCMAIVGGALIPLLTGNAADVWGLKGALMVPAACYLCILVYGSLFREAVVTIRTDD